MTLYRTGSLGVPLQGRLGLWDSRVAEAGRTSQGGEAASESSIDRLAFPAQQEGGLQTGATRAPPLQLSRLSGEESAGGSCVRMISTSSYSPVRCDNRIPEISLREFRGRPTDVLRRPPQKSSSSQRQEANVTFPRACLF